MIYKLILGSALLCCPECGLSRLQVDPTWVSMTDRSDYLSLQRTDMPGEFFGLLGRLPEGQLDFSTIYKNIGFMMARSCLFCLFYKLVTLQYLAFKICQMNKCVFQWSDPMCAPMKSLISGKVEATQLEADSGLYPGSHAIWCAMRLVPCASCFLIA